MSATAESGSDSSEIVILDAPAIQRAIRRIAHEIVERNPEISQLAIIGVQTRGVEIGRRMADHIEQVEKKRPAFGFVDIAMHRDDLRQRPSMITVKATDLPFDLDRYTVVLVDDVAFTGRSCRAAMDALSDYGRPQRIQFAALIDRGHRELPIHPDYVGKNVPTSRSEKVRVRLREIDHEEDSVRLVKASLERSCKP